MLETKSGGFQSRLVPQTSSGSYRFLQMEGTSQRWLSWQSAAYKYQGRLMMTSIV